MRSIAAPILTPENTLAESRQHMVCRWARLAPRPAARYTAPMIAAFRLDEPPRQRNPLAYRKPASGGPKPAPRHRLSRFAPQPTDAPWKNRLRYDGAWRGAPMPQNGHRYRTNNKVCSAALSPQQRASLLSFGSIPGHQESVRENGIYLVVPFGIFPGGYVDTRFSGDHNQVVNVTTWLHGFVGSITRTIYSNSSGTFVETIGVGDAGTTLLGQTRDFMNDKLGPVIFNDIDRSLADRAHRNIPGC